MFYLTTPIRICLVLLVMATSPLVGVILARLTKEELSAGKKYFSYIIIFLSSLIVIIGDLWIIGLLSGINALNIIITSAYLLIVTVVSLNKS